MRNAVKAHSFLFFLTIFAVLLPAVRNAFVIHVIIMIFTAATMGLAWNIIGGFGGQLSLGHAAFYGIGAYTSTLMGIHFGISPWIGMVLGGLLAVLASLVIGIPCFKLRGTYFTLATIAFAEVLRILCIYYKGLTEGSLGIALKFNPGFWNMMFESKVSYAYIALVFMALTYYCSRWIERSRLGYYLIGLKENEDGVQALGVNTYGVKLTAFMISAFITAVIGSFFAQYILFIDPHGEFSLTLSIFITLPVMIGGIGTTFGPIIGALIITPLQELPSLFIGGDYQGLQHVFFGLILIVVVLWIPQGVVSWGREKWRKRHRNPTS